MWQLRPVCPGCHGQALHELLEVPYSEPSLRQFLHTYYAGKIPDAAYELATYRLQECRRCGLIFQDQVPDDELSQIVYEPPKQSNRTAAESFEVYEGKRSFGHFLSLVPDLAAAIEYLGGKPRQLRVLDFGMGWGNWLQLARGFGCRVVGLESSPIRIAWAREQGLPVIGWDDLRDEQFDLIHTEQVIEHVAAPREIVERLTSCLRPGGLLKLSVPNGRRFKKLLDDQVWKKDWRKMGLAHPIEHLNVFHSDALTALAAGLELERVHLTRTYEFRLEERLKNVVRPMFWKLTGRASTSHFYIRPNRSSGAAAS